MNVACPHFQQGVCMDNQKWKFDRTISVTHLFTTLSAISAALFFAANINTRVTLLEQTVTQIVVAQNATDARQDAVLQELRVQTRDDYKAINAKLDRIMERAR